MTLAIFGRLGMLVGFLGFVRNRWRKKELEAERQAVIAKYKADGHPLAAAQFDLYSTAIGLGGEVVGVLCGLWLLAEGIAWVVS